MQQVWLHGTFEKPHSASLVRPGAHVRMCQARGLETRRSLFAHLAFRHSTGGRGDEGRSCRKYLRCRKTPWFTFTLSCHLGKTHDHRSRGDTPWYSSKLQTGLTDAHSIATRAIFWLEPHACGLRKRALGPLEESHHRAVTNARSANTTPRLCAVRAPRRSAISIR